VTAPSAASRPTVRSILAACLPAAAAIAVFGVLYGAAARVVLGPALAIASSLLIFSGALQFALVGLLAAGATVPALLVAALTLNLRHLVLGAVLRPRIGGSRARRAALSVFLVDETFGFALAAAASAERAGQPGGPAAERTLWVAGLACYLPWQVGTRIGVAGAAVAPVEGLAGAIFPVLFIGLASLSVRRRSHVVRALVAAALTAAFAFALPDLRAIAPVVAGVLAALPGQDGGHDPGPPAGGDR
jgi:predicted branched-subunit amino acid permease